MKRKALSLIAGLLLLLPAAIGQRVLEIDLQTAIRMATDSSLQAFRYKNQYMASYWEYRSYKADRLPSLSLQASPATYNRTLVSRYDSNQDADLYRQQKSYSASGSLLLSQNFAPLGGSFYLQTSVDYLRYFGATTYNQFSVVPIILGYRHNVLGYNEFRWDKKIEPMKYEAAKLQYLYNAEQVATQAVRYFFALATAQLQYKRAVEQAASCDSLLVTGERKQKIAAISKSDLLSLRLDAVNARNAVAQAEVQVRRATLNMTSFLGLNRNTDISVVLPGAPSLPSIDTQKALDMMSRNSYLIMEKRRQVIEAERTLDKTSKTTRFNASVSASVGFNQTAETISDAYHDPLRKDVVSVSVSIPLVDWGVGRGHRNNARNNLNIARIDEQQTMSELEQDVIITIAELGSRYSMMQSAEEALVLADAVYRENKVRFLNGTCDMAMLSTSQQRLLSAQNGYIESMSNYWQCYYSLRQQTLFDFMSGFSLSDIFDFTEMENRR
ncbi:MAG: TolC family protein [Bacteroidales bacterium]|jgi:outer membrane protein TolC|nr:TolC family protein [Bacteroidales bacterium]